MSKPAVEQATTAIADGNARYGIRANSVLPGLIETPMGVDHQAGDYGLTRDEWVELRNKKVPLKKQMGTAWDVAHAALFLASDEAKFVTGVHLTRSEEHTSELQSLMRNSYAVFCLKKKKATK